MLDLIVFVSGSFRFTLFLRATATVSGELEEVFFDAAVPVWSVLTAETCAPVLLTAFVDAALDFVDGVSAVAAVDDCDWVLLLADASISGKKESSSFLNST